MARHEDDDTANDDTVSDAPSGDGPANDVRAADGPAADLVERVDAHANALTPQERRLAAHLVEHLERWGYLSSSELAAELSVHRSTIVRFAQHLGFAGYPELQEEAREAYVRTVTATRDLVLTDVGDVGEAGTSAVQAVYQRELQNLRRSYTHLDLDALDATARGLAFARRVLLFGRRFSYPIALHMSLVLRTMRERVDASPAPGGSAVDQLFDLGPEDFAVVVSLRRHSPEVQRTLRHLAEAEVPRTVLPDASPGNDVPAGTNVLRAHVGSTGVLDSYTALVSVSHALLTLVEAALPAAAARLAAAERAWQKFNKDG
jgi:DNA-binding MurR/RpiR family transcriptional regulator